MVADDQARPVISARKLAKSYGPKKALGGVDLDIFPGEIFGVLGNNGAGKTTLISIMEGLLPANAGTMRVLGRDPRTFTRDERGQLGVQFDTGGSHPMLTGRETLALFHGLYGRGWTPEEMLAMVGLEDGAKTQQRHMSTGMKRRLALAVALIGEPKIVFLDEPSLGLDPLGRRQIWQLVRSSRSRGTTVVLTTNVMEEAAELCDRVLFLKDGTVAACGGPEDLTQVHTTIHRFELEHATEEEVSAMRGVIRRQKVDSRWQLLSDDPPLTLADVMRWQAEGRGRQPTRRYMWRPPSLEDVFFGIHRRNHVEADAAVSAR
jgi:ABC-2 type transport system ATP-binding protein